MYAVVQAQAASDDWQWVHEAQQERAPVVVDLLESQASEALPGPSLPTASQCHVHAEPDSVLEVRGSRCLYMVQLVGVWCECALVGFGGCAVSACQLLRRYTAMMNVARQGLHGLTCVLHESGSAGCRWLDLCAA